MTDASLFEKMCRPLDGDFLPTAFPLPLQQYALSGSWTERHLTETERSNWLARMLLTYVLHKRSFYMYADRHVPVLLSPQLGAWLNEETESVHGLPVTRLMQYLAKQLAPYDRIYDLKKTRSILQLYGDLAGQISLALRLPTSLLPGFIFEHLAAPAPLPGAPVLGFPLSIGMAHLWRTLFPSLAFEPASAPHAEAFAAQFLSLVIASRIDARLVTKEFSAWLNKAAPAGQTVHMTNFMALVLRLAGVQPDARWSDEGFLRAVAQQIFIGTWPTITVPPDVAATHEKIAAQLGITIPKRTGRAPDDKEPAYIWGKLPARGLDPASKQVNVLAVDDVAKHGARLSQRLQAAMGAGGISSAYLADKSEVRMQHPAKGPINLFACRLDGVADFMLRWGLDSFEGRYNIGYGTWETDRLPQGMKIGLGLLDEIWVATEAQKKLFEKKTDRPVFVLPHPVNEAPIAKTLTRAMLGIPEDAFLFTTVVDTQDWLSRKNPLAALQAFQAAFPKEKNVALLVKTRDIAKTVTLREEGTIQRMQNIWNADSRIFTVHDELSDAEMQALLNLSDAYISLHRSSAYGAAMIEAMALGKPVIATHGSGPADYLNAQTGFPVASVYADVVFEGFAFLDKEAGHGWADPETADAAAQMKHVFTQRDAAAKIALEGQKQVQALYNAAACGKAMAARINAILQSDSLRRKTERAA